MDLKRIALGALGGLALAAAILIVLREVGSDLLVALTFNDLGSLRVTALWLVILGMVVGVVMMLARRDPTVGAVGGFVVLAVYLPLLLTESVPSWYPEWLSTTLILTTGPTPFIVSGILIGAAAWGFARAVKKRS